MITHNHVKQENPVEMQENDVERDIVATGMVLLAEQNGLAFRKGEKTLPPGLGMMSYDLVRIMLKMAMHVLRLPEAGTSSASMARPVARGEDVLLAAAFDYTIELAPKMSDPSGARVIDVEALRTVVGQVERAQGVIGIDHDLADRITMAARMRLFPEIGTVDRPMEV